MHLTMLALLSSTYPLYYRLNYRQTSAHLHYLWMATCKLPLCPFFFYCLLSGALGKLILPTQAAEPCEQHTHTHTHKASVNASRSASKTPPKTLAVEEQSLLENQEEPQTSSWEVHMMKLNNFLFQRKFINPSEPSKLRSKLEFGISICPGSLKPCAASVPIAVEVFI